MKEEKKKNGVIILLVVIIVILLALVILLATGTISFKAKEVDNNSVIEAQVDDDAISVNISNTMKTANWKIDEEAKKYVTLEDVSLTDQVSTKRVKLVGLDDNLTNQFYKDQQTLIENIHIYNDEYVKGGANYKVKAFVNNNILSVIYLLEEKNAVGVCGTKLAVANIDLTAKKVVSQEQLLASVKVSYKKLVDAYYEEEKENWAKHNEQVGNNIDYYEVTFGDFSNNKEKYVNIGLEKIPNIIYAYIENGKVKYDYYTIHIGTLFHQVGKGGCFDWATTTLGDYQ